MGKYEEALERAKEIYNAPVATIITRTFLEQIFPELKESEDERIRKELIDILKKSYEFGGFTLNNKKDLDRYLAYLEKQKEQKPAARENDFVSKPQTSVEILRHYLVWAGNSEEDCPYTWKTLADAIRDGIKALEEQQPAEWSEEDEKTIKEAIHRIEALDHYWNRPTDEKLMERLKSLCLRSHWKPSEAMLDALKWAKSEFHPDCPETMANLICLYNELKKL